MADKELNELTQQTTTVAGDLMLVRRGTTDYYIEEDDFLTSWPFAVNFTSTLDVDGVVTAGNWGGGPIPSTTANNVVIAENGNAGASILTPNSSVGSLLFGDPESATSGRVRYLHSSNTMEFWMNDTQYMSISSSGVDIKNSAGLRFNSGDNLGTYVGRTAWTPVLNFGGATTGITYARQTGYYMRLGPLVVIQARIELSSKGTATGAATITGIPVNEVTTANLNGPVYFNRYEDMVAYDFMGGYVQTSSISLVRSNSGAPQSALTDTDFEAASDFEIGGFYFAA